MSDKQDEEVIASHAYRDGKIFFTVTITTANESTYLLNRADTGFLIGVENSLDKATELADMYLLGITTGYDLGIEHANKEHARTKHERTKVKERVTYGCICGCGRSTTVESERRD